MRNYYTMCIYYAYLFFDKVKTSAALSVPSVQTGISEMASFVSCTNGKGSQRNGNPKDLRNRIGSERDWTCDGLVLYSSLLSS